MTTPLLLARELADEIEEFPLGSCGPSDDPEKQYVYTSAFRDIALRFVAAITRIGDPELRGLVTRLHTSPANIIDAHHLRANLLVLIDMLREIPQDQDQEEVRSVSEVTRRAIIDSICASGIKWAGRLEDDEFLARLYDLTSLPSQDHRMPNAAADIHQHRVNWADWPDDWIFHDSRFNLLRARDQEFLRFLCETVHPVVRSETDKARELVSSYNQELFNDGWALVEVKKVSGKPVFEPRQLGGAAQVFEEPTGWPKVDRQLQQVKHHLDTSGSEEQYQAVGLFCREVLISVAQEVYDPSRHPSDVNGPETPSDTDAGRMLEAFFAAELKGGANEEARRHAKAALRLALALQHKRTADFRMAALCAEATSSVVNILAVLSGRRGRLP